jgi:hypothetical protein
MTKEVIIPTGRDGFKLSFRPTAGYEVSVTNSHVRPDHTGYEIMSRKQEVKSKQPKK